MVNLFTKIRKSIIMQSILGLNLMNRHNTIDFIKYTVNIYFKN